MTTSILLVRLSDFLHDALSEIDWGHWEIVERSISSLDRSDLSAHYEGAIIELARQDQAYDPAALEVCRRISLQVPTVIVGSLACEPLVAKLILVGSASFMTPSSCRRDLKAFLSETIMARRKLYADSTTNLDRHLAP